MDPGLLAVLLGQHQRQELLQDELQRQANIQMQAVGNYLVAEAEYRRALDAKLAAVMTTSAAIAAATTPPSVLPLLGLVGAGANVAPFGVAASALVQNGATHMIGAATAPVGAVAGVTSATPPALIFTPLQQAIAGTNTAPIVPKTAFATEMNNSSTNKNNNNSDSYKTVSSTNGLLSAETSAKSHPKAIKGSSTPKKYKMSRRQQQQQRAREALRKSSMQRCREECLKRIKSHDAKKKEGGDDTPAGTSSSMADTPLSTLAPDCAAPAAPTAASATTTLLAESQEDSSDTGKATAGDEVMPEKISPIESVKIMEKYSHPDNKGYKDASVVPDLIAFKAASSRKRGGGASEPFPQKLHRMLEDLESLPGGTKVASFLPHGRAFFIHDPDRFVADFMPRYFRMSRMASFQRQLNLYDFERVGEGKDKGAYYHELFLRGRPILCLQMRRTKIKGRNAHVNRVLEPIDFYSMPPVTATDAVSADEAGTTDKGACTANESTRTN